jgi:hypothetical protein
MLAWAEGEMNCMIQGRYSMKTAGFAFILKNKNMNTNMNVTCTIKEPLRKETGKDRVGKGRVH